MTELPSRIWNFMFVRNRSSFFSFLFFDWWHARYLKSFSLQWRVLLFGFGVYILTQFLVSGDLHRSVSTLARKCKMFIHLCILIHLASNSRTSAWWVLASINSSSIYYFLEFWEPPISLVSSCSSMIVDCWCCFVAFFDRNCSVSLLEVLRPRSNFLEWYVSLPALEDCILIIGLVAASSDKTVGVILIIDCDSTLVV